MKLIFKREDITESGARSKTNIRKRYSLIDIYKLAKPLVEGDTLELSEVYIGNTNKNKFITIQDGMNLLEQELFYIYQVLLTLSPAQLPLDNDQVVFLL